jgi:hypothetical protein
MKQVMAYEEQFRALRKEKIMEGVLHFIPFLFAMI